MRMISPVMWRAFFKEHYRRLFAEAHFQVGGTAAEDLGLGGLRHQRLFEFGDPATEIFDLSALFRQFMGGGLELDALGVAAVFHRLEFQEMLLDVLLDAFVGREGPRFAGAKGDGLLGDFQDEQ